VRAVQRLVAPYATHEPRPLVCVFNDGSDTTSVTTYELNIELLRELKKQSTKIRNNTLHAESAATQTRVNSHLLHKAEDYVGVLTTPLLGAVKSDFEAPKPVKVPTARSEAKKFVREFNNTMAQLTDEALNRLADQIAVKHPRSRLRNLAIDAVGEPERAAILNAMGEEAILRHMNMAAAGRAMLSRLDEWDSIPRSDWHLTPEIAEFYELRSYRGVDRANPRAHRNEESEC